MSGWFAPGLPLALLQTRGGEGIDVELRSLTARIRLAPITEEWWSVRLEIDGREVELGADTPQVIAARLTRALADDLQVEAGGRVDDVDVGWVVSLSEKHGSVYVSTGDSERTLYFQDSYGGELGRAVLSDRERREWLVAIEAL